MPSQPAPTPYRGALDQGHTESGGGGAGAEPIDVREPTPNVDSVEWQLSVVADLMSIAGGVVSVAGALSNPASLLTGKGAIEGTTGAFGLAYGLFGLSDKSVEWIEAKVPSYAEPGMDLWEPPEVLLNRAPGGLESNRASQQLSNHQEPQFADPLMDSHVPYSLRESWRRSVPWESQQLDTITMGDPDQPLLVQQDQPLLDVLMAGAWSSSGTSAAASPVTPPAESDLQSGSAPIGREGEEYYDFSWGPDPFLSERIPYSLREFWRRSVPWESQQPDTIPMGNLDQFTPSQHPSQPPEALVAGAWSSGKGIGPTMSDQADSSKGAINERPLEQFDEEIYRGLDQAWNNMAQ